MEITKITSRQNARVKEAVKLRSGRHRVKSGRFLIDGVREIARALSAAVEIEEVYFCPQLGKSPEIQEIVRKLGEGRAVTAEVTPEVYEKLAFGAREDGLLAVARTPQRSLAALQLPNNPLIAVLEGLEKPGNVGAILRTADGAGVDAVIVTNPQTDLFNPNTIRASVGTVFAGNVCTATVEEVLPWLRGLGSPLIATRPDAERLYTEVDFRQGAAILLGSEATGLSAAWQESDVSSVRLPMHGIADSLNVSATAAVLFYEARRQRQ